MNFRCGREMIQGSLNSVHYSSLMAWKRWQTTRTYIHSISFIPFSVIIGVVIVDSSRPFPVTISEFRFDRQGDRAIQFFMTGKTLRNYYKPKFITLSGKTNTHFSLASWNNLWLLDRSLGISNLLKVESHICNQITRNSKDLAPWI